MLLSQWARFPFHWFISFLCFTKLIPYNWSWKHRQLTPAAGSGLLIFHLHSSITFLLAVIVNYRVTRAYMSTEKKLALQQKVMGVFGALCHAITALAFAQLELQRVEVMQLCNRVLSTLEKDIGSGSDLKAKLFFPEKVSCYLKHKKALTKHMITGLFVLATNIPIHVLIPAASPCAPHLITSMYFECKTYEENNVPPNELFFLLFPEFYTVTKFLIMNCFFWAFLMMGLGVIVFKLEGLQNGYNESHEAQTRRLVSYRGVQLFAQTLNGSLFYYLSFFTHILFFILSILLFGAIRLWRIDPRISLSFPGCGLRCGYEVISPMIIAGKVDMSSAGMLSDLHATATRLSLANRKKWGRKQSRVLAKMLKSCVGIRCTAGNFFMFENFFVISSLDGVVETTFDLLCTFKDELV